MFSIKVYESCSWTRFRLFSIALHNVCPYTYTSLTRFLLLLLLFYITRSQFSGNCTNAMAVLIRSKFTAIPLFQLSSWLGLPHQHCYVRVMRIYWIIRVVRICQNHFIHIVTIEKHGKIIHVYKEDKIYYNCYNTINEYCVYYILYTWYARSIFIF